MKKIESTGKYISYLSRLILGYSTNRFKKYNLSAIEYTYLMILKGSNSKSQQQLTKEAFVDKAQTTRAINSLLQKDLVTKKPSLEDKRSYLISLTKKGLELVPSISHEIEEFEQVLNQGLSKQEQRQMKSMLIKMIRNMKGI